MSFKSFTALSLSATAIFISFLLTITPTVNAQSTLEESATSRCLNALMTSPQQIQAGGPRQTRIEITTIHDYLDHPAGRPQHIILAINSRAGGKMPAAVVMLSTAKNIINNCDSVGLVTIGIDESGALDEFGIMRNGEVRAFECIEPDIRSPRTLPWGQRFCI